MRERTIRRLLVANRGELVPRIARTCRETAVVCIALASSDQADAWWTRQADEVAPLRGGYLEGERILEAARACRADAIHPGYGFLAESADFVDAVHEAGLLWVGPAASAMRALGDKAAGRQLASRLGVPLLPGYDGAEQSDAALSAEAARIGFPVLLKPSGGGGGKGMHVVRETSQLPDALARARREARAAFGDERLLIERYIESPRHVEIQILGDHEGNIVQLGERDCSLQRRHQKVIEESPSPAVDQTLRQRLGDAAVSLGREGGYASTGTVEFLLDDAGRFYFLEVNARLQVEHPVTELVSGRDLVADQLRVARGEPLGFVQEEVGLAGHAIEARIYAEDPWSEFLPVTGRIAGISWPDDPHLRVDAGVGDGDEISLRYDPLVAKLVARGHDRGEATLRLRDALDATRVWGITTNRGFLRWLLETPDFVRGDARTDTIERTWHPTPIVDDGLWARAAGAIASTRRRESGPIGFRLNAQPALRLRSGGEERTVELGGMPAAADWRTTDAPSPGVVFDLEGTAVAFELAAAPSVETALEHAVSASDGVAVVAAPMPGTVMELRVSPGDRVMSDQAIGVLEAMKMEHPLTTPRDGRVRRVLVSIGDQVERGQSLVEIE